MYIFTSPQLVSKRDDNVCNFLEGGSLIGGASHQLQWNGFPKLFALSRHVYVLTSGGSDYKLIYRHYATLYFVFCVDSSESELGILDLIQVG